MLVGLDLSERLCRPSLLGSRLTESPFALTDRDRIGAIEICFLRSAKLSLQVLALKRQAGANKVSVRRNGTAQGILKQ